MVRNTTGAHFVGDQVEQESLSRIINYYLRNLEMAIEKALSEF